jgi:hypothetical protein
MKGKISLFGLKILQVLSLEHSGIISDIRVLLISYYLRSILSGAHAYQDPNFKNFDQKLGL